MKGFAVFCSIRIKQFFLYCLQTAAMLVVVCLLPINFALAEDEGDGGTRSATPAVANGFYGIALSDVAVDAPRLTSNINIVGHGVCRYVDVLALNASDNHLLIPFKSALEWQRFITNVNPLHAYLDLCRPVFNLNSLEGGLIDFAGGLSTNDMGVPANERGTVDPAGTPTAYPVADAPQKRIDTRSDAALTAFRADDEVRNHVFNMARQDCRMPSPTVYPDGTTATVCNPQSWVETVYTRFHYNISADPLVDSDNNAAVMARITPMLRDAGAGTSQSSGVGTWLKSFLRDATIPPYSPPPLQNCAGYNNGDRYWVDQTWQEDALACPGGTYSDPGNPYRRRYLLEREYQCFDGSIFEGSYPMPNIREKAGTSSMLGACLPIVNGACNTTYHNQNFYTLDTSSNALCAGGSTVYDGAAAGLGWSWGCKGTPGFGTDTASDACRANRAVDAALGPAAGRTDLTGTPTATDMCTVTSVAPVLTGDGSASTPFSWTCTGYNGGQSFSATAQLAIPPACNLGPVLVDVQDIVDMGAGYGGTMCDAQWTLDQGIFEGTCNGAQPTFDGTTSCLVEIRTRSPNGCRIFYRECEGAPPHPRNGECGDSHNGSFTVAPTSNLCRNGPPSTVTDEGSSFEWTCAGRDGGSNASCSATKGNMYQWVERVIYGTCS